MESSKIYFLKLLGAFWFMFFLILIFLIVTVFIIKPDREDDYDLYYIIIDIIVMLIGYYFAYSYPNQKIKRVKRKNGIHEKLSGYRIAMLVRWIVLTLVALYSIFAFIMTREYIFVCTTLFTLGVLLVTKSSKEVLSNHLNLNSKERSVIYTSDAAV